MLTGERLIGRITETKQYGKGIHVTFQYSVHEFQDFVFDESDVPKICELFNVVTINEILGRYVYCILTKELCPIIKGLRLLEPDQDMKKTREIVLK